MLQSIEVPEIKFRKFIKLRAKGVNRLIIMSDCGKYKKYLNIN